MSSERIYELINTLEQANKAYYVDNKSIMSNRQYDELYNELIELEKTTGIVLSSSPTQKVGGEVADYLEKVEHPVKMLSLDKTKDKSKLKAWLGNKKGVLSFKLDGLTVVFYYKNGVLDKAVTRGNGKIGEDITHNIPMFSDVPLSIPEKGEFTARGEAFIDYTTFEKINSSLPEDKKYKNPRNLCSGTIRQLDSSNLKGRGVKFYLFDIITTNILKSDSKLDSFEQMGKELGFATVPHMEITADTFDDVFNKMESLVESSDIPTDGLVLSYDSISYGKSLGATSHHDRHSMAFKWKDELVETTLREIEWNTSRTGILTPVAIFDAVDIEGTTIERASVHNLSILEELELGVGDTIQVYKANMIIPQIEENLTRSGTCEPPEFCSSCGEPVVVEYSETGVKTVVCHNNDCPAQIMFRLKHFCSRDAMNIKGLSEATLERFIEQGWLNNLYDIYELKNYKQKMIRLPRFGEKSVSNILDAIENSRHVDLPNFLYSLGISAMGRSNSKLLCEHFDNDLNKIRNADFNSLMRIDGFGPETTREIINFFGTKENSDVIDNLLQYISFNVPQEPIEIKETSISGQAFVITGSLINFKNRKELENLITTNGGIIKSSVSKLVNYLINNDVDSTSSKNLKAKELGIVIISEDDLLNMIG